ncbi:MAG: peptidoglycan-binding protein, partial [Clostridia bacterium]|nr:peptidoglycan-binding protein [Clostridia bacterium]
TEKAVIKYQEAKGLEVDGIAGEQTIKSLGG